MVRLHFLFYRLKWIFSHPGFPLLNTQLWLHFLFVPAKKGLFLTKLWPIIVAVHKFSGPVGWDLVEYRLLTPYNAVGSDYKCFLRAAPGVFQGFINCRAQPTRTLCAWHPKLPSREQVIFSGWWGEFAVCLLFGPCVLLLCTEGREFSPISRSRATQVPPNL
jgi:hypothetical protein